MSKTKEKSNINLFGKTLVVVDSSVPSLKNKQGFVVDETKNSFVLSTSSGLLRVLKKSITFQVEQKKYHGINFMKTIENRIQR